MCICVSCAFLAHRDQENVSDLLDLELQMVGCWELTLVLWKSSLCSYLLSHLFNHKCIISLITTYIQEATASPSLFPKLVCGNTAVLFVSIFSLGLPPCFKVSQETVRPVPSTIFMSSPPPPLQQPKQFISLKGWQPTAELKQTFGKVQEVDQILKGRTWREFLKT